MALMGPSGSGKTTLLNLLARRQFAGGALVTGELLVDGHVLGPDSFRTLASYVEQEDVLIGALTARETIDIAASLSRSA